MSRNYDNWEKLMDAVLKRQQFLQFAHAHSRNSSICSEEDSERICAGCDNEVVIGRYLNCTGSIWHPECFCCHACKLPISDNEEFSRYADSPYHELCHKNLHYPKCDVCINFIPINMNGLIEYRAHPFWHQKYCPSHEADGTPRCYSCERMEAVDARHLILKDGRVLCLECMDSSITDTHECQPLYLEIREFYAGLNIKVEQQIPFFLVERQALDKSMEGENNSHHIMPEFRGICVKEQTVETVLRRPRTRGYKILNIFTTPYKLVRKCEVTAILAWYGFPRLLTGSILANRMMSAWLRLQGYPNLSPHVEEGMCQVLAYMWLDSEIAGSSVSSALASPVSSKNGKKSESEIKLGEFFKHQIESDVSVVYGDGFRQGYKAVQKHGLMKTLHDIRLKGTFPM